MNEPIRCRSLISLVARYPSNQREMNSHCAVTEKKMTVVVVVVADEVVEGGGG